MASVKIKILVAVDDEGNWVAMGSSSSETTPDWLPVDDLGLHLSYLWVEAEIPIPEIKTVQGGVTSDE